MGDRVAHLGNGEPIAVLILLYNPEVFKRYFHKFLMFFLKKDTVFKDRE